MERHGAELRLLLPQSGRVHYTITRRSRPGRGRVTTRRISVSAGKVSIRLPRGVKGHALATGRYRVSVVVPDGPATGRTRSGGRSSSDGHTAELGGARWRRRGFARPRSGWPARRSRSGPDWGRHARPRGVIRARRADRRGHEREARFPDRGRSSTAAVIARNVAKTYAP